MSGSSLDTTTRLGGVEAYSESAASSTDRTTVAGTPSVVSEDARFPPVSVFWSTTSAVAAMRTGHEIDALVNLDPAITELVDHGEATIMVDSRTPEGSKAAFGGDYLADCLTVKTDFLKANPKTAQAVTNAVVHAMQWLKTASIDDIIAILPKEFYRADEKVYRESLKANLDEFTWDGIVTPEAARNVLTSISVLEPALRSAKIDPAATYDNALVQNALQRYRVAK